jgi:uncharacterized protein (TIGR00288 family)
MPARPHRGAPQAGSRAPVAPVHQGPGASTAHGVQGAPNAALLIDFDNVTLGIRSDLQTELRNLLGSDIVKGKVAVQRAYADWRRYPQYIVPLSESSIDLIFAPAYGSSKKNATDIRLAVDAIELVFTRPEIGTFILLSGDSDFSSMVLKLKEYGKYVIGVGIRESSSDLLVQNCDEYYSYNALAGLVKSSEEDIIKKDPWDLVVEAVQRMVQNGDVMRADRLKQVMQEIDPSFDEGNLGMAKFSRFCMEAAQKGLIKVTKLDNGQLEVAPADEARSAGAHPARTTRSAASAAKEPAGERAERPAREGRSRRGRRGGRGRGGRDRAETPRDAQATPAPADDGSARDGAAPSEIGRSGERLSRDEALSLVKRAVADLVTGDAPAASQVVRQRAFEMLGRDSESLSDRFFTRILRDAHDAGAIDLRKHGNGYEVAVAAHEAPVMDQLASAAPDTSAAAPPAQRVGSMTGRRPGRSKAGAPPADLLSVGVVELDVAEPVAEKAPARRRSTRKKVAKGS